METPRGEVDGEHASASGDSPLDDADLESVRDAFVDVFNSRDLDGVLDLLEDDVELADQDAEGGCRRG